MESEWHRCSQPDVSLHRSHFLVSFCHRNDKGTLADVTGKRTPTHTALIGYPVLVILKRQIGEVIDWIG
jgi:hypothetical protein